MIKCARIRHVCVFVCVHVACACGASRLTGHGRLTSLPAKFDQHGPGWLAEGRPGPAISASLTTPANFSARLSGGVSGGGRRQWPAAGGRCRCSDAAIKLHRSRRPEGGDRGSGHAGENHHTGQIRRILVKLAACWSNSPHAGQTRRGAGRLGFGPSQKLIALVKLIALKITHGQNNS